ncbi:MAG: hypothetical protein GEV04_17640 [Actinophytocola sp.]|nr:hypothetical protein [Actinophytocola sp.]
MLKAYTYPENPAYRANAADLVELRATPHGDATAFRITYNTMTDPGLVATTIALGSSVHPRQAPPGANAATGQQTGTLPATVDVERRQAKVRAPTDVFDPTSRTVRLAAATGLWDTERGRYLVPQPTADADTRAARRSGTASRRRSSTLPSATTSRWTAPGATGCRSRPSRAATSASSTPRRTSPSWHGGSTTT